MRDSAFGGVPLYRGHLTYAEAVEPQGSACAAAGLLFCQRVRRCRLWFKRPSRRPL